MLLKVGERLHVITRRTFDQDLRRHFAGEVTAVEGSTARLDGYAFVYNPYKDEYIRRPEKRTRFVDVADGSLIVHVLPESVVIEDLEYAWTEERRLMMTDGKDLHMDINEFGHRR